MVDPNTISKLRNSMKESQLWHSIRMQAENDLVLKEMLEQVKVYYLLKYDHSRKTTDDV